MLFLEHSWASRRPSATKRGGRDRRATGRKVIRGKGELKIKGGRGKGEEREVTGEEEGVTFCCYERGDCANESIR